jgi:hypothetical protein
MYDTFLPEQLFKVRYLPNSEVISMSSVVEQSHPAKRVT